MSYGGGGTDQSSLYPASPWPASLEVMTNHIAAANVNPFTGQQQIQDWQANYMEISVSLPAMSQAQAQNWIAFLKALNGPVNVFAFPSGTNSIGAKYSESLMNGASARYWRLKSNQVKWTIRRGSVYGLTFECREAI